MAELAGLFASIIAIVGVAGTATKLSISLYKAAREAGAAGNDIKEFALKVQSFASIMEVAHGTLQKSCSQNPSSTFLKQVQDKAILDQLTTQSRDVVGNIKVLEPKISALGNNLTLISRFRWLLRKSEVQALGPKMETVKTSLILVMQMANLEILLSGEQTNASVQEIKRLTRQIKVMIRSMNYLQAQLERANTARLWTQNQPIQKFYAQITLVQLGENMGNTRVVQDAENYQSQRHAPITIRQVPPSPPHNSESRARGSSSVPESRSYGQPPTIVRSTHPDVQPDPPTLEGRSPSSLRTRVDSNRPSLNPAPPPKEGEIIAPPQPKTSDLKTQPISQNKSDAFPIKLLLCLHPNHKIRIKQGYINNFQKPIKALIDYDFGENFISLAFIMALGLQMHPLNVAESILIEFPDEREETPKGTVEFEWGKGPESHRMPFKVRCLLGLEGFRVQEYTMYIAL
ncbi:hypothetical protein B7494_g3054 [Chlorociboria aeruginascens]|nr:hypothetical protein B7494_g3054 [Chlorociboria aeruginascens]